MRRGRGGVDSLCQRKSESDVMKVTDHNHAPSAWCSVGRDG